MSINYVPNCIVSVFLNQAVVPVFNVATSNWTAEAQVLPAWVCYQGQWDRATDIDYFIRRFYVSFTLPRLTRMVDRDPNADYLYVQTPAAGLYKVVDVHEIPNLGGSPIAYYVQAVMIAQVWQ